MPPDSERASEERNQLNTFLYLPLKWLEYVNMETENFRKHFCSSAVAGKGHKDIWRLEGLSASKNLYSGII